MTRAAEHSPARAIPEAVELCARCLRGVVFYRGRTASFEGSPYCPTCGAEKPGIRFVRAPDRRAGE